MLGSHANSVPEIRGSPRRRSNGTRGTHRWHKPVGRPDGTPWATGRRALPGHSALDLRIKRFSRGGHGAQALARPVDGAHARPFFGPRDDIRKTKIIGIFERPAKIARQAEAKNEAHVDFPRRGGNAFLGAARG